MARSDAAWVDVLPQMKNFAGPLLKNVKEASKKAGAEGGRALADGMSDGAKHADMSPAVAELERVEKAARKTADEQAASARKAATEVSRSQSRIIDARNSEKSAAAQLGKAEADLERRRVTSAEKSDAVEQAERKLAEKRQSSGTSADELAKAERELAAKRADSAKADADVEVASARVETARDKQARATDKVSNEEDALRAAMRESKVAQDESRAAAAEHAKAQEALGREVGDAAQEAQKAVPMWKRLWQGMDGTSGLKKRITSGLASIRESVEKEGKRIQSRGDALLGGIGKGVKWGATGIAAGIGAGAGAALYGGFNRLADIEDARASLEGLGKTGKQVDQIMDSALTSVKGTAYSMGDAASLAATMTAAGIKPGKDLTDTLSLVADSATIAKRDLGDMGLIWSSVASKGKLQGDDAMQLLESGIPIWQMVGDVMGKTAGEAQALGTKGEVSFDIFAKAMEKNLGGAAQKSGKTVRGSFANLKAAVSRLGAGALEEFYPLIAPALAGVTSFLDGLSAKATPVIKAFTKGAKGLYDLIVKGDFTSTLTEIFGWHEDAPIVDTILTIRDGIKGLWDLLVGGDFTGTLREVFGWDEDSAVVGMLFSLRDAAIAVGGWFQDHLMPILAGVGGALAYLGGSAIVGAIGSLIGVIAGAASAIGWIPLAIGAAVGAITWFFTQTQLGQSIVTTAWEGIQTIVSGVATWFTETAWPALVDGWGYLTWAVSQVWPVFQGVFSAIGSLVMQVWQGVIQPALAQFAGYLQETVAPIALRLWTDYIQPTWVAIAAASQWLWFNVVSPALSALASFISNTLAPTIVWLWQNVVSPAFSTIGSIISWVWNSVIFPALDALKFFLVNILAPTVVWLWKNVVSPAFSGISWSVQTAWSVISLVFAVIKWTIENVLAPSFKWLWHNVIEPAWDGIWGTIKKTWGWIRDKVFTPLKNFIGDKIAPAFETGVGAIGKAWSKLKSAAMKPVQFVVDTVINKGIIDNFNKVADVFGTKPIKRLTVPGSAAAAVQSAAGLLKGAFAGGGILPGRSSWRDGDDQLISARRGEGILVSEGLRDPESQSMFMQANTAARTRGVSFADFVSGAFAEGGLVKLRMPFTGSYPRGDGFGARGGAHKGIDFPMPMGTVLKAVAAGDAHRSHNASAGNKLEISIGNGLTAGYHHLSSYIAANGASVGRGADVARVGSTGHSSGPHLHFSMKKDGTYVDPSPYLGAGGAAGSGSGGSWWNPFTGLWKSLSSKVRKAVGDTKYGDMMFDSGKWLVGKATSWVTDKIASLGDLGSDLASGLRAAGGTARWTPLATKALTMTGQFSAANLAVMLNRLMQESSGDPNAINRTDSNAKRGTPSKGLMQVIDPTFRAYAMPGYDTNIWDPLSNMLASIRYATANYPSLLAAYGRKGGYTLGGIVEPLTYDEGGWLKPGLSLVNNASGVPEPIFTGKQGDSILAMLERGGTGTQVHMPITATELSEADVDRLADEIMRRFSMSLAGA